MKILVIGGDSRQIYCAGRLALLPYGDVSTYALKEDEKQPCSKADIIVLPYVSLAGEHIAAPLSDKKISLSDIEDYIKSGTIIFAGMLDGAHIERLEAVGAKVFDWFGYEELTLKNAELTAEGAAQVITGRSHKAVSGSKLLILGWGRVAKACARLFRAMGGKVTVAARKESARSDAENSGFKTVEFIDMNAIREADIVVNTVPQNVLTAAELNAMNKNGWILELASKPYGFSFEEAKMLGVEAVLGSGLPGKYTPEAAGLHMAETVIDEISKRLKGGTEIGIG